MAPLTPSKPIVVVLGDVMVDAYWWGKVSRISPEAPVGVLEVASQENRLGGAANVALNLKALGVEARLVGLIGKDALGDQLPELLAQQSLSAHGLVPSELRPTTVKTRMMAGRYQLLRADQESTALANEAETEALKTALNHALDSANALIIEDYDKGVLTPALIRWVIGRCNALGIPVVVDPKKRQFWDYQGATVFKPNLKEMIEGLNARSVEAQPITAALKNANPSDESGKAAFTQALAAMQAHMPHTATLLTLSEHGCLTFDPQASHQTHFPAHLRQIADVSGAGDTVVAVVTAGLAAGLTLNEAAEVANLAGGLVCEKVGVVPVDAAELSAEVALNYPQNPWLRVF